MSDKDNSFPNIVIQSKEQEKLIFIKCKQSVLEIVGWKSFIFLPSNFVWRFFIITTVIINFVTNVTSCFHDIDLDYAETIRIFCNICYLVDVLLATSHYFMGETRKLRHEKKRHFSMLIIDYISLLPLSVILGKLIHKANTKKNLSCYFHLNQLLRVYQVPESFNNIKHFIYKLRTYIIITFLEVISYLILLTCVLSCIMVSGFDEKQKTECEEDVVACIFKNYFVGFCIFAQIFISPFRRFSVINQKVLLVAFYIVGYLFTYSYLFPLILYMFYKYLVKYFKGSVKWGHLKAFLKNMIEDRKLKNRVLREIYYSEIFGKGDQWPDILNVVPVCFRKNIFCDMHWDAFRHSGILQDISVGCKRSLALHMTTEFILPGTKLIKVKDKNFYFMYIESGLLQIMCEENEKSPEINFTSGSVLGEICLFLQTESKVVLRAGHLSAVHFLHFKDFFRVILDYPNDSKIIHNLMSAKLKRAKSIYVNKTEIKPLLLFSEKFQEVSNLLDINDIRWLKEQFRAIYELEEIDEENITDTETMNRHHAQIGRLKTRVEHTSMHLPHININDDETNAYDLVCIKNSFPWVMNPDAHFFRIWEPVTIFFMIFTVTVYPAVVGWMPYLPQEFLSISIVVSAVNIIDVLLQLFTAIKRKNVLISKFSGVLFYRANSLAFWADIVAAVPVQLFINYERRREKFVWKLYFLNALLKAHKMISSLNKWTYSSQPNAFLRVSIKYFLFFVLFLIWTAAAFNIIVDDWYIYKDTKYFNTLNRDRELPLAIEASIVKALFTVLKIPGSDFERDIFKLFFSSFFFNNFFHFFFIIMISECIAVYVVESIFEREYRLLMKYLYKLMGKLKLVGRIRHRMVEMMMFQLNYEKGQDILQRNEVTSRVSVATKKEIVRRTVFQYLAHTRLFEEEDKDFLWDLCKKAISLFMPKNSVLLTFGTKPMHLFVIQKGFIQINSFISQDLHMNISTPMVAKPGDAFPVIDAFSQSPAAVTAIAITDCELIQLDLEEVISTMLIHGTFKDLVEALKETNLSALYSAKLGLTPIKERFKDIEEPKKTFKKSKGFKFLTKSFLERKAINPESNWYIYWELGRIILIFFSLMTWPIVFGYSFEAENLVPVIIFLLLIDYFWLFDIFFRLYVGYYNKIGIYVTHFTYTSKHYFYTSFIIDFLAFAPNFQMLWYMMLKNYKFGLGIVVSHLLLRLLSFYRIYGFFTYMSQKNVFYNSKLVKFFLFVVIGIHSYVNVRLFNYFKSHKPKSRVNFFRFLTFYFNEVGNLSSMFLKNTHHFEEFRTIDLIIYILLALLGYFLRIYIYGNITLNSITEDKPLNFYQYYVRSFIQYLKREKANEELLKEVEEYYKNNWELQEGRDLKNILAHFPQLLQEDIAFLLYKETFTGVGCFLKANKAFFRILSRNAEEVLLLKNSLIIFKNQVQENIYFIHEGKCSVENFSTTLYKGSIIGNFQAKNIMKNTVVAKTNVKLLKISSEVFFMAIDNFHHTKMAFLSEAANNENFITSFYFEDEEVISEDFSSYEKSKFLPSLTKDEQTKKTTLKKKKFYINPSSATASFVNYLSLTVVYLTMYLMPIFIVFRVFSPVSLIIVYFLDLLWVIKIILNMRTAYYDEKSETFIYGKKDIRHRYMRHLDGFVTHLISVLPLELIPLFAWGLKVTDNCCVVMSYFYVNRFLRFTYLSTAKKQDETKLLLNFPLELVKVLISKLLFINGCVSFHMLLKDYESHKLIFNKCYWKFEISHVKALMNSYLWVLHVNVDEPHSSHHPEPVTLSIFRFFLSMCSFMSKVLLLNDVLMVMFFKFQIKSDEMLKLEQLENFLAVRNVSPILFKRTQKYFCYLLHTFNETAEPLYLRISPTFIKVKIMQEFYAKHVFNCYLFKGIDEVFVRQLADRLERQIFFPGDYVTMKGDVDHNMYFIHQGEIFCIESDKNIKDLEEPVDLYVTGENFGILQGVLAAFPHKNTYRAKTLSDLLVLNYYKWSDMRMAFPDIANTIYKRCLKYKNYPEGIFHKKKDLNNSY